MMQLTDDCLIWSGNEKAWPFREKAVPAPRGHKPKAEMEGGPLLFRKLHEATLASGAEVVYDARVLTLVTDGSGRVVGVVMRESGQERTVRAARGVVLCTGGFALEEAMVRRHIPQLVGRVELIGNPYDDGAGIRMGMGARGATIHMDAHHITLPHYPPSSLTRG